MSYLGITLKFSTNILKKITHFKSANFLSFLIACDKDEQPVATVSDSFESGSIGEVVSLRQQLAWYQHAQEPVIEAVAV